MGGGEFYVAIIIYAFYYEFSILSFIGPLFYLFFFFEGIEGGEHVQKRKDKWEGREEGERFNFEF